jgi:hypothetical protein
MGRHPTDAGGCVDGVLSTPAGCFCGARRHKSFFTSSLNQRASSGNKHGCPPVARRHKRFIRKPPFPAPRWGRAQCLASRPYLANGTVSQPNWFATRSSIKASIITSKRPLPSASSRPIARLRATRGAARGGVGSTRQSGIPVIEFPRCRAALTLRRITESGRLSGALDPHESPGGRDSAPKSRHPRHASGRSGLDGEGYHRRPTSLATKRIAHRRYSTLNVVFIGLPVANGHAHASLASPGCVAEKSLSGIGYPERDLVRAPVVVGVDGVMSRIEKTNQALIDLRFPHHLHAGYRRKPGHKRARSLATCLDHRGDAQAT